MEGCAAVVTNHEKEVSTYHFCRSITRIKAGEYRGSCLAGMWGALMSGAAELFPEPY